MTYAVQFEARPGYLFAHVTGTNNRENVMAYMQDVRSHCEQENCFRVLIHEELAGDRLDSMDVFSITSEGSMRALGCFDAIAYVDEEMEEHREFAETVSVNRGMPVAFFNDLEAATRWIEARTDAADSGIFSELAD